MTKMPETPEPEQPGGKLRGPSIQWYYRQWLGDQNVLAMDWDAQGMHFWLINLSLQEDPPGTIPDDMKLIRKWLHNPHYQVWNRVRPQIFKAWQKIGGRWHQLGTVVAARRQQENSAKRRDAANTRWEGQKPADANASGLQMQIPMQAVEVLHNVCISPSSSPSSSPAVQRQPQVQILSPTSSAQAASTSPPGERRVEAVLNALLGDPEYDPVPGATVELSPEEQARYDKKQAKLESDVVEAQFRSYLELFRRDPARYTLTPKRKHYAMLRLHERIKVRGSLPGAMDDFQTAMHHLHADDYMRSHKWFDWGDHLFATAEEFEKRLNWQPPDQNVNGGKPHANRYETREQRNQRRFQEALDRVDHEPPADDEQPETERNS